jgi:spore coat protein A
MFTRRLFLKAAGFSGLAALGLPLRRARAQTHGSGHGATTPSLPAFVDPLPIPPVLKPKKIGNNDTYRLIMQAAVAKCHRDLPFTNIHGFNGLFPGPTIRVAKNRQVQITQINNLPNGGGHDESGMTPHYPAVHLHGGLVAPESDGHPKDEILAGASRRYTYPNRQRGCGLWYHDHTHGATGRNVYMGLAGLYFIDDPKEKPLRLPRGPHEIPLVIQDRTFDETGQFHYLLDDSTLESGIFGDVVLVNGKIQPYLEVAARKYRFRVLNASNARQYNLALSSGAPLIQIGTDGGLLQRPQFKETIKIAPSERVDLIVDFSGSALGASIILQNRGGEGRTASIMEFRVNRNERENAIVPAFLTPWQELGAPLVTREFTLNRISTNGALTWVINGDAFDSPGRVVPTPKLDSIEHWRFINPTNHPHPMHLHLVQFQVVNIDGEPQDPSDFGWKDTVVVPPGSEVTVATKFSGYLGKYVFHCHNLEHEDFAMMGEFEVVP